MGKPTEQDIAARAYRLWEAAGEPEGKDEECSKTCNQCSRDIFTSVSQTGNESTCGTRCTLPAGRRGQAESQIQLSRHTARRASWR
jgi:Protein of unknown function (DUF2934)